MVLSAALETARLDLASHQPNQFMNHPVDLVGGFDGTVPLGYSGNAAAATADEGEAIVAALTNPVIPFLHGLNNNGWTRGTWMSRIE